MSNLKELIEYLGSEISSKETVLSQHTDYPHSGFCKYLSIKIAKLTEIKGILESILYPGKCPKCGIDFSIDKLMEDVEHLESLQQENYHLGLKHGMEAKEQKPPPDEEFIQNTYDEIYTHITYDIDMRISIDEDEVKNIIRKLLQGKG